jgi:hypothetical protein
LRANSAPLRVAFGTLLACGACGLNRRGVSVADADSDTDSDAGTDTGSDGGTDSDSVTDTGSDSDSETGTGTGTGTACAGEGDPCYDGAAATRGVGTCRDGAIGCPPGGGPECEGDVLPAAADACDGRDDDCDGTADDGFACVAGAAGIACNVGGCDGAAGCGVDCTLGPCVVPDSGDDDCEVLVDVSGGGVYAGSTCGAGDDLARCGGGAGAPDVVYAFNLQGAVHLTATVDADGWRPTVSLRDGALAADCPGDVDFDCASDADGDGLVTLEGDYACSGACPDVAWIAVDGVAAADQGDFTLTVEVEPQAGCDAVPYVEDVSADTCGAGDQWRGACAGIADTDGSDLAYWFTVDASRDVTFETCGDGFGWDSIVYVTHECESVAAETVECNDDGCGGGWRSSVTASVDPGLYYVVVDSYAFGICGGFRLSSDL